MSWYFEYAIIILVVVACLIRPTSGNEWWGHKSVHLPPNHPMYGSKRRASRLYLISNAMLIVALVAALLWLWLKNYVGTGVSP